MLPLLQEWARFRGSRAIVGLVGLVPSCHRAFVGPKVFLVRISWAKIFSGGYFVDPRFYDFQCTLVKSKKKHMIEGF